MNEFGEPNMVNPSVRFDEGRERVGHWPFGLSNHPLPPTLRGPPRLRMGTRWAARVAHFCRLAKSSKEPGNRVSIIV